MTSPTRTFAPDRTHRAADYLLPPLMAAWAAAAIVLTVATTNELVPRLVAFPGSWLVGILLVRLYWSRYRVLGFVPFVMTVAAIVAAVAGEPDGWPIWLVGIFALLPGVAIGAVAKHRGWFRVESRRYLIALGVAMLLGFAIIVVFAIAGMNDPGVRHAYRWLLVGLTIWTAVQAWLTLFRPAFEVTAEPLLWGMYRVKAAGPGLEEFPRSGPVLVIANHAAWFDPLYLIKSLPRPVTPMMTARFYNLRILRPILRHVYRVIVVPESPMRREAPEVNDAIAALDAGYVVVIFPEGYLRRKEEPIIRRFGQGVWQMLQARPETPVVACWIEGGWGSFTSYKNGRPTKNKTFDIRWPISIGLSAPETVSPEVLAEHLPTRIHLMNRVLEARKHLGLPAVPPVELPTRDEPVEEPEPSE